MLPSVSAPARVLIVDKDPVLLEELRMATHSEGWVCATARGVGAALAVATEHRPQVAVVAYILPDGMPTT